MGVARGYESPYAVLNRASFPILEPSCVRARNLPEP
jgi:hypothetical protein